MDPADAIVSRFDMRMLRILQNRFPYKHCWDLLAIGQILLRKDLSLQQKRRCMQFYVDPGPIRNLYATLTRSGSHWSILGLTIAKDLADGGDGEYWLSNEIWRLKYGVRYLKFDWRVPTGEIFDEKTWGVPVHNPMLFHSHHPYFRIRSSVLKKMKIVISLRSIHESMESKFFKLGKIPDQPDNEDEENFRWIPLAEDAIEFYNSWGDVVRWHPNCRVYKYEDLLADPIDCHKEISDFWGLNIPRSCISDAFKAITKEKMKEKITASNNELQTRVSYRSKSSKISPQKKKKIDELIDRKLVYDFGYGLNR